MRCFYGAIQFRRLLFLRFPREFAPERVLTTLPTVG